MLNSSRLPFLFHFRDSIVSSYLELKHRQLKLKIGKRCHISSTSFSLFNTVYDDVKLNKVSIGPYSYVSRESNIHNTNIGSFCSIGPGCKLGLGRHPSSGFISTHPAFYSTALQAGYSFVNKNCFVEFKTVEIGHDVWIGANAIINDGVKVGSGAIIGAGAVVVENVPEYGIVGGVPAKLIRYRFEKDEIDFLLHEPWWEKSSDWLQKNIDMMQNIKHYLEKKDELSASKEFDKK